MIEVAAGLLFHQGELLITQRPQGTHLAGLWEFPGGKRKPSESFQACLARELNEELGILVSVGNLWRRVTHAYPGKDIYLEFYLCSLLKNSPPPAAIGCAALQWVTPSQIGRYEFPEADRQLVDALQAKPGIWRGA